MSSFTRTLQKRMLKKIGYTRQTERLERRPDGTIVRHRLKKGRGPIVNPAGDPWNGKVEASRNWPTRVPS